MSQDIHLMEQWVESDGQWCPLPPDTCEIIFCYKDWRIFMKHWILTPHCHSWSFEKTSLHRVTVRASNQLLKFVIFWVITPYNLIYGYSEWKWHPCSLEKMLNGAKCNSTNCAKVQFTLLAEFGSHLFTLFCVTRTQYLLWIHHILKVQQQVTALFWASHRKNNPSAHQRAGPIQNA